MTANRHGRWGGLAMALGLPLLAGCLQGNPRPATRSPMLPGAGEPAPTLGASQVADVQVAMGRALEKRGDGGQAEAAYREALKRAPGQADALGRLAVLYDRQGKFKESEPLHLQALAA